MTSPCVLDDKGLKRRGMLAKRKPTLFIVRSMEYLLAAKSGKNLTVGEKTKRALMEYAVSDRSRSPIESEVLTAGKFDFQIRLAVKKNLTTSQIQRRELLERQPEMQIGRVTTFIAQVKKIMSDMKAQVEEVDDDDEDDQESLMETRQSLKDYYMEHYQHLNIFAKDAPCDGMTAEEIFLAPKEVLSDAQREFRGKLYGRVSTRKSSDLARAKDPEKYLEKRSTDRQRQRRTKRYVTGWGGREDGFVTKGKGRDKGRGCVAKVVAKVFAVVECVAKIVCFKKLIGNEGPRERQV